jgi:hypothetical protein
MTSYRGEADYQSWPDRRYQTHPITLPKGTVLEVDRVYIRNFNRAALEEQDNFDSITFKVVGAKKQRFWVKLKDANHIQFKLDTTYAVREKIAKQLVHG